MNDSTGEENNICFCTIKGTFTIVLIVKVNRMDTCFLGGQIHSLWKLRSLRLSCG